MGVKKTDSPLLNVSTSRVSLQNLPSEIQLKLCGYFVEDCKSLAAITRSCKGITEVARMLLYENITIDTGNLAKLFAQKNVEEGKYFGH
jgi:hypothetical protein